MSSAVKSVVIDANDVAAQAAFCATCSATEWCGLLYSRQELQSERALASYVKARRQAF